MTLPTKVDVPQVAAELNDYMIEVAKRYSPTTAISAMVVVLARAAAYNAEDERALLDIIQQLNDSIRQLSADDYVRRKKLKMSERFRYRKPKRHADRDD